MDITADLDRIHEQLAARRLTAHHAIHTGPLIREHYAYFTGWDRIVIYYDNGQKEITNLEGLLQDDGAVALREVTRRTVCVGAGPG